MSSALGPFQLVCAPRPNRPKLELLAALPTTRIAKLAAGMLPKLILDCLADDADDAASFTLLSALESNGL